MTSIGFIGYSPSACERSIATQAVRRLSETDKPVKRNLYVLANDQTIGKRLIEAFETDDKAFIAEKLGFSSVQGVYKVLSGDRELDFEKLQRFRDYTKCSIDWLLTGEGPKHLPGYAFDIERSIEKHDNWRGVMEDWFEFEGREMPDTLGASFMGGWESFDRDQKIAALKDFKLLLDRIAESYD